MDDFYGRHRELSILKELLDKRSASLVVIRGRRRIGKSRLAEKFCESFPKSYTFIGLSPEKGVTAEMEREHFANALERQTGLQGLRSDDWDFLFHNLSEVTKTGRVLIVLDEINWMGTKDAAFLGKLKTAWDDHFKKNPELIMILSGSMSTWIEKNILSSTGYFGRVELDIVLKELPLYDCNHFWRPFEKKIAPYEKFKILCATGGVPRYLESIDPRKSAEENIKRLFYRKEGLLFKEFDHIFSDLFGKKSPVYKKIVQRLAEGPAEFEEIYQALDVQKSGVYSDYLDDLKKTGYISRDFSWKIKEGKFTTISQFRLSDNYLRFYLKYIDPYKENILNDQGKIPAHWHTIMGLQFENLVLNNRKSIYHLLNINPEEIQIDNPFFQHTTSKTPGVQIDYLIQTRMNNLYLFEIKFKKDPIGTEVISEVQEKIRKLSLPRGYSLRTVLIHVNGVTEPLEDSNFFSHIIDFGKLFEQFTNETLI
jgi:AAA+ ATPase superfamily predicted ATPase